MRKFYDCLKMDCFPDTRILSCFFSDEGINAKPGHEVDGTLNTVDSDQTQDPGANNPKKEILVQFVHETPTGESILSPRI